MKKVIALLLVAMMTLSCVAVFAEGNSKGAGDVRTVTTKESKVIIRLVDGEANQKFLEKIKEFLKNSPLIDYFPADIAEKLGETDLEMNELYGLEVSGYTEDMGEIEVYFSFDTPYNPENQKVFVLIGVVNEDGNVTNWEICEEEVQANGDLLVRLTPAQMKKFSGTDNLVIAVLNTPAK